MNANNEFPKFPKDCNSLLSKYLTKEVFDSLKDKKTAYGFTLKNAIASGVENSDSGIGVYAGDIESYSTFASLFDEIIKDYHGFLVTDSHKSNLNPDDLKAPNPDSDGTYIVSTRIRVGRNFDNMPLGPAITKLQRDTIEKLAHKALNSLDGKLKGTYYPLNGMSEEVSKELIRDHFLFKAGDRFLESSGFRLLL